MVVLLDTSIIIEHLRRRSKKDTVLMRLAREREVGDFAISLVTVQELYEGRSTKDKEKEARLRETIDPIRVLPYSVETAILAGMIARDLTRPIEFADAAIAATAVLHGVCLATFDRRDFVGIEGLKLIQIE